MHYAGVVRIWTRVSHVEQQSSQTAGVQRQADQAVTGRHPGGTSIGVSTSQRAHDPMSGRVNERKHGISALKLGLIVVAESAGGRANLEFNSPTNRSQADSAFAAQHDEGLPA